jgi:hypothetical protein
MQHITRRRIYVKFYKRYCTIIIFVTEAEQHAIASALLTTLTTVEISTEHIFCVFSAVVDLSGL